MFAEINVVLPDDTLRCLCVFPYDSGISQYGGYPLSLTSLVTGVGAGEGRSNKARAYATSYVPSANAMLYLHLKGFSRLFTHMTDLYT